VKHAVNFTGSEQPDFSTRSMVILPISGAKGLSHSGAFLMMFSPSEWVFVFVGFVPLMMSFLFWLEDSSIVVPAQRAVGAVVR
jgi:hypothetical protein